MYKKRKGFIVISLIICMLFSMGAMIEAPTTSQPIKNLVVHYIDVGQADSILIQTPNGKNMLIDAGNNDDSQAIDTYLKTNGVSIIDVLVGTHPHEDHVGSMDDIIQNFTINSIYMPKVTTNTATFMDVLQAIKDKGLQINTPVPGSKIAVDSDLDVTIVAPNNTTYEDLNNYSIVLKVVYKNNSFLFTGDAEAASEAEMLLKAGYDIKADVLKVGHHGSSSSTTEEFVKTVAPKYAVISVGKGNDYGHPTADTLARLTNNKVEVYRTDLSGTIVAISDGSAIKFDKVDLITPGSIIVPVVPTAAGQYIGNKNSKIFHKTTCNSLPQLQNQVKFDSREEAIEAGYRPCQRCNP